MLSKNGEDRPSASECLNHIWITQDKSPILKNKITPDSGNINIIKCNPRSL